MVSELPLLSPQLAFAMEGQRTGLRGSVCLQFTAPAGVLVARDVDEVLQAIVRANPAFGYRPRFSRGEASQEWHPAGCDVEEVRGATSDDASALVVEAVARFEQALDGAPMAASLIRTPAGDRLAIVLDHGLVDQQSLVLVTRQLCSPPVPVEGARERFEAAVLARHDFEQAAGSRASSTTFWLDRLRAGGDFPRVRSGVATTVPSVELEGVEVPGTFSGSLFPAVLFSLHRAIREALPAAGTPLVGYPWGGRDGRYADVVGCFMNTAVSMDTTAPGSGPEAVRAFRNGWFDELDHIDVPLTRLMGLGSGFTGAVMAYLSYSNEWIGSVDVAGTEVSQRSPAHAEIPVTSTFQAAATVRDGEVRPWLFVDEDVLGGTKQELGERWRGWLRRTLADRSA